MKTFIKEVVLLSALIFTSGCGSSDSKSSLSSLSIDSGSTIDLGDTLYHLPGGVKKEQSFKNSSATLISSEEIGGVVFKPNNKETKSRSLSSLKAEYNSIVSKVENSNLIYDLNYITQQEGNENKIYIKGDYDISTNDSMSAMELVSKLTKDLTNDDSVVYDNDTNSQIISDRFVLTIEANEYIDPKTSKSNNIFIITAVAKEKFQLYVEQIKNITNYTNITRSNLNLQVITESFTQTSSNNKADFLFVVDDSPSMSDNQNAISKAGEDFENIMHSTGLDANFAIITTDSYTYDWVVKSVGYIHNDYNLFRSSIIVGDNGNPIETGIYDAESFLKRASDFPRINTDSLSVVIISDEQSQYDSVSSSSFDPKNNIFKSQNIRVYSIIDTSQNDDSQYDDLSIETGGIIADINHIGQNGSLDFSDFMRKVASDAVGRTSRFILRQNIILNRHTIVKVNSRTIQQKSYSSLSGWVYEQASNSIAFYGDSIPRSGESVTIEYQYDDTGITQNQQTSQQNHYKPITTATNNHNQTSTTQPSVSNNSNTNLSTPLLDVSNDPLGQKTAKMVENLVAYSLSSSKMGLFAIGISDGSYDFYRFGMESGSPILEKRFQNVNLDPKTKIIDVIFLEKGRFRIYTNNGSFTYNYFDDGGFE